MNTPEQPPVSRPSRSMSAEAVVGTGITVGSIGVLFLLLGWAQFLREAASAGTILAIIGAVLLVAGGVIAGLGQSRKPR